MRKRVCSFLISAVLVLSAMGITLPMTAAADTMMVVTVGADLTEEQKNMILNYFNVAGKSYTTIVVNNDDEWAHLGGYMSRDIVGYRTISCALIRPMTSGGIQVKTANLTYVTSNMIASNLATAGVTNCEVLAAAPFQVSGTGALTGALMAYENLSGVTLDNSKKQAAAQEFATTYELGQTIGQQEAQQIVNDVKMQVINGVLEEDNSVTYEEITEIVNDVVNNYTTVNNTNINNVNTTNTTNNTSIVNNSYLSPEDIAALQDFAVQIAQESYEQGTLDALAQIQKTLEGQTQTASTPATIQIEQNASLTVDPSMIVDSSSTNEIEISAADQALSQDSLLTNTNETALAGTTETGSVISSSTAESTIDTTVSTNLDAQLEEQKAAQEEAMAPAPENPAPEQTPAPETPAPALTPEIPAPTDVATIPAPTDEASIPAPEASEPAPAPEIPAPADTPEIYSNPVESPVEVPAPVQSADPAALAQTNEGTPDVWAQTGEGTPDIPAASAEGTPDEWAQTNEGTPDEWTQTDEGNPEEGNPEEDPTAEAANQTSLTYEDENSKFELAYLSYPSGGSAAAAGSMPFVLRIAHPGLVPVSGSMIVDADDMEAGYLDLTDSALVRRTDGTMAGSSEDCTEFYLMPKNRNTGEVFRAQEGQNYHITLEASFVSEADNQNYDLSLMYFTPSGLNGATSASGFSLNAADLNYGGSVSANVIFPSGTSYCIVNGNGEASIRTIDETQFADGYEITSVSVTAGVNGDGLVISTLTGGKATVNLDFYESQEAQEAGAGPAASVVAVIPFF